MKAKCLIQFLVGSSLALSLVGIPAFAQKTKKKDAEQGERETIAKPLSDREKKKREDKLRRELETPFRKWLNEDVFYIITDEEKTSFKRMSTDDEREQFIEQFWLRRDPTPDTIENEEKEEHTRGNHETPHELHYLDFRHIVYGVVEFNGWYMSPWRGFGFRWL